MKQIAYNLDCMKYMATVPDKYFDLAVVDPPYGNAGKDFKRSDGSRFGGVFDRYCSQSIDVEREREEGNPDRRNMGGKIRKKIIEWDTAPGEDFFIELFRVSRNQIIWGANYFRLPPTRCFIIWEKTNIPENFSMSMCEYAWTSFNDNAKIFKFSSQNQKDRFHPTQKPVELYQWIYQKYAKPGDRILDTHLGSGSSRIAAYKMGFDFVGCEIDKTYFEKQEERFQSFTAQMNLFAE